MARYKNLQTLPIVTDTVLPILENFLLLKKLENTLSKMIFYRSLAPLFVAFNTIFVCPFLSVSFTFWNVPLLGNKLFVNNNIVKRLSLNLTINLIMFCEWEINNRNICNKKELTISEAGCLTNDEIQGGRGLQTPLIVK